MKTAPAVRTSPYRLLRTPPPPVLPLVPDEAQREVLAHCSRTSGGPLLVLAGPGTGKTTTLVEAVARRMMCGHEGSRIVEPEGVDEYAKSLARAVKATLAATEAMTVERAFAALRDGSIPAYDAAMASADAEEGPQAFAEGREPVWRGE